MKFKVDPDKGLMVTDPMVPYPVSSEFGRKALDWYVKETGKVPRIVEHNGEQCILMEWSGGTWSNVDDLLGRLFVEDSKRAGSTGIERKGTGDA